MTQPSSSESRITRSACCPLCHRSVSSHELREHIEAEKKEIRDYTIDLIKSTHPEWVLEDGSCPKCWELYRRL